MGGKCNTKNLAVKRILQEVKQMQSNSSDDLMSLPLKSILMDYSSSRKRPRNTCSLSAESIGHSEYLITQISMYLPVKSILRFKSVSRQWLSLLTLPMFITLHKSNNSILYFEKLTPNPLNIQCLTLKENSKFVGFDNFNNYLQNPIQGTLSVASSCNGLLLISSTGEEHSQRQFFVCNPFTRKHVEIMIPDIMPNWRTVRAHLAFDPCASPFYKVIFFWSDDKYIRDYNISIYSSETKTCSKIGHTFVGDCSLSWLGLGVFFNGSIFWRMVRMSSKDPIYYFDINQESVKLLPSPCNIDTKHPCMCLKEIQGHLYVILYYLKQPLQHVLELFELKEDYSGWAAKYKVDIESIAVEFPEIMQLNCPCKNHYCKFKFHCVLEEEDHELFLVLSLRNQLFAYNPIDKTSKKLGELPFCDSIEDGSQLSKAYQCKESLFLV